MKIENAQKGEHGFTLIELLVVIAIIGILASIAIPQFTLYRQQAADGAAQSQLRNMAVSLEGYFVTANDYGNAATVGLNATEALLAASYGYSIDASVTVAQPSAVTPCTAGESVTCFSMDATHIDGTGTVFTWTSDAGGAQW